jgi:fatty acid desaturase
MADPDLKLNEADQNQDGKTTLKEKVSFQRRLWSSTPVKIRRIIVAVIGGTLVLLGAALIVLPGPFTMPLVIAGLVVLSSEFAFAERLLVKSRAKLQSAMKAVRRKK